MGSGFRVLNVLNPEPTLGFPPNPVFRHLPGHRITVNPEQVGSLPDAAFRALQGAGDKHFLELLTGVVVAHAPVEHFLHERFELFAHGYRNSRPDRSR